MNMLLALALLPLGPQAADLRIQVWGSDGGFVPNMQVDVVQQGATASRHSNPDGSVGPAFPLVVEEPFTIRLNETVTVGPLGDPGRTLGQELEHVLAAPQAGADLAAFLNVIVPVAEFTTVHSEEVQDQIAGSFWSLSPFGDASYNFQAHVGYLANETGVTRYVRFHDVSLPRADYVSALVLRTEEVALGAEGLLVEVDLSSLGLGAPPFVDPCFLDPVYGPGFSVEHVAWVGGTLVLRVTGTLGAGGNALFFYEAPVGQVQQGLIPSQHVDALPPTLAPLDEAAQAGPGHCIPPASTPVFPSACTPPKPRVTSLSTLALCPPPFLIKTYPPKDKSILLLVRCEPAGSVKEIESHFEWKGTFTFKVLVQGTGFEAGEEISESFTERTTYPFGGPCGECYATYLQLRRVVSIWDVERGTWDLECTDDRQRTMCIQHYLSSNVCPQTCP